MLNYGPMELIDALEEEFASQRETANLNLARVLTRDRDYELRLPQLGIDFVAGLHQGAVLVLPISKVTRLVGSQLPIRVEQTLEEFLERQKTPIRLLLSTTDRQETCWLLNLQSGWIRVAISHGVSWVPMEAIQSMEIVAVDNSNHRI